MSHGAIALVWHHSKATGTDLLVLMAIANFINEDGAFPKVATIAKQARVGERQAARSLANLRAMGEIETIKGAGAGTGIYKTSRYHLLLTCPPECARDWNHTTRGVTSVTPETSRPVISDTSRPDNMSPLDLTEMSDKPVIEPVKEPGRATTIPSDFAVTDEMRKWAAENHPRVDIDLATLDFVDYWETKAGDNKKTDWTRTWQRWIRTTRPNPEWKPTTAQVALSAEEAQAKRERARRENEEFIREQQAKTYEPIPLCEHGNNIAMCLTCIRQMK